MPDDNRVNPDQRVWKIRKWESKSGTSWSQNIKGPDTVAKWDDYTMLEVVPLSAVSELREPLELAVQWFANFKRKPDHEGVDVTGVETILKLARVALARLPVPDEKETPDG